MSQKRKEQIVNRLKQLYNDEFQKVQNASYVDTTKGVIIPVFENHEVNEILQLLEDFYLAKEMQRQNEVQIEAVILERELIKLLPR